MASPFWEADPVIGEKAAPAAAPANNYFWSKDEIVQPAEKPGMLATALRSAVQGATFGLADESYGLTQGIGGLFSGEGFGPAYERGTREFRARDKAGREANPITGVLGEIAGGMATGYGAASAGATLMRGGMSLPQAIAAGAGEGGIYGALHGAGNAEGGIEDRYVGARDGARTGMVTGAAVPIIARGIGAGVNAIRQPTSIPADRQAMVDVLRREGVPITAGQATNSTPLKYAESILGDAPLAGGRSQRIMTDQAEAFTSAALRRAGESGRATPETMANAYSRIGGVFDDLSARNTLRADPQLGQDIAQTLREYDRVLTPDRRRIIGDLATDILDRFRTGNGTMPGREYQTIRSRLGKRAMAAGQDTDYADASRGLRNALDRAMARSISPADAQAWAEANRQYGAWKTLAKAVGGAGSNPADGLISPQALRQAVASGRGKEAYVRGEGDFADLARAGSSVMTPLPNSGTAQRATVGSGVSALAAALAGNGNLGTAAITAVGPGLAGRALLSETLQGYLSRPNIGPATRRAIERHLRGLIQGGAQTQSQKLYSPRP